MSTVNVSHVSAALKRTLKRVVTDKGMGMGDLVLKRIFSVESSSDAYEDDQEWAGTGFAQLVPEGEEIPVASITPGFAKRYVHQKYGLRMIVTEEAIEDNKYKKAIQQAMRLRRSLLKTAEVTAAQIFIRAWNTAYPGGDGVPLCSTSHPLADGGSFSNTLAIPLPINKASISAMTTAIRKFPSHDGHIGDDYQPKALICPMDLHDVAREVTGSKLDPVLNNPSKINVVRDYGLEVIPYIFWSNTTSNWGLKTNAMDGFKWFWRKKPATRSWKANESYAVHYSDVARWSVGWTDPRCFYGSQI